MRFCPQNKEKPVEWVQESTHEGGIMTQYVSGLHALNLGDRRATPGDWHYSSMDWKRPFMLDSSTSPFGEWDIHEGQVPGMGRVPVAGHMRACVDLIEQGQYGSAQGMRDQFLDNPSTTLPIMQQVWKLRGRQQWPQIDWLMGHEYYGQWLDFKEKQPQDAKAHI
jgi:hypothetical protein